MEPHARHPWHVVVPVKGGPGAKTRLRSSLDSADLIRAIAHDTLEVAASAVGPRRLVVVTSDPDEAAYAVSHRFAVVPDPGAGLDAAALAGVDAARRSGGVRVAILLGDHPALTVDELLASLDAGEPFASFFVPDADGRGTALVGSTAARAGTALELGFGTGSAARHTHLGHERLDLDLPGLRHDVDDMASLLFAREHLRLGARTREAMDR